MVASPLGLYSSWLGKCCRGPPGCTSLWNGVPVQFLGAWTSDWNGFVNNMRGCKKKHIYVRMRHFLCVCVFVCDLGGFHPVVVTPFSRPYSGPTTTRIDISMSILVDFGYDWYFVLFFQISWEKNDKFECKIFFNTALESKMEGWVTECFFSSWKLILMLPVSSVM